MRPAYVTRCPNCMVRVEVPDEMQKTKVEDKTVYWFDPDLYISKKHSC